MAGEFVESLRDLSRAVWQKTRGLKAHDKVIQQACFRYFMCEIALSDVRGTLTVIGAPDNSAAGIIGKDNA